MELVHASLPERTAQSKWHLNDSCGWLMLQLVPQALDRQAAGSSDTDAACHAMPSLAACLGKHDILQNVSSMGRRMYVLPSPVCSD
jgi:hypothetical protein